MRLADKLKNSYLKLLKTKFLRYLRKEEMDNHEGLSLNSKIKWKPTTYTNKRKIIN